MLNWVETIAHLTYSIYLVHLKTINLISMRMGKSRKDRNILDKLVQLRVSDRAGVCGIMLQSHGYTKVNG